MDCRKCPHSQWGWDDAYGAFIRFVDGCDLDCCPYEEDGEEE